MNKDKTIKDLKERNDKLLEQYRYRDIRCITLEKRLETLEQENKQLQQENEKIKLNHKQLKDIEKTMISNSRLIQENKELKTRINKAIEKLDELNVKFKKTFSIGIDVKEISEIKKILKGEDNG